MRRNFFLIRPVDQGSIKSLLELILLLTYKKNKLKNIDKNFLAIESLKLEYVDCIEQKVSLQIFFYNTKCISILLLIIRNLKYLFFLLSMIIKCKNCHLLKQIFFRLIKKLLKRILFNKSIVKENSSVKKILKDMMVNLSYYLSYYYSMYLLYDYI